MSANELIVSLEGPIRIIKFNRPERKNAMNINTYKTISEILNGDADNDAVAITIITGNGEYYSSGFDIKEAVSSMGSDNEIKDKYLRAMILAFINYPKLLIAVINGPAIGIGATSAALCDIIYASDKATFETPFVKLGLCAEGCSSYTLAQLMGRSKASEMLLLGQKITALEAYQFGLVARVVPHEQLQDFIKEFKKKHCKARANGIKINKNLITKNFKGILCECNEREMEQLSECYQSEELYSAIMDFMNRKSKL